MPRYEVKTVTAYTVVDTETGLDYRTYDSNEAASAVTEALNDLEAQEAKAVIDATEDVVAEKPIEEQVVEVDDLKAFLDGRSKEEIAADAAAERLTGNRHYKGVEIVNSGFTDASDLPT